MGTEIIKKDDQTFQFNNRESHDIVSLLIKYRNEELAEQMINNQMEKEPQLIEELQTEKGIREKQLKNTEKAIEDYEKALKKANLDIEKESERLRNEYTEEQLEEKASQIPITGFSIQSNGETFERTHKVEISKEQLCILYQKSLLEKNEILSKLAEIEESLNKKQNNTEERKNRLQTIQNSKKEIENTLFQERQVTLSGKVYPLKTIEDIQNATAEATRLNGKKEAQKL